MSLKSKIKQDLENFFLVGFEVKHISEPSIRKYVIYPSDCRDTMFQIEAIVKDETRLTVTCQPQKYGVSFLENIECSEENKRRVFIDYWKQLQNVKNTAKVNIYVNNISVDYDYILNQDNKWKKFQIRYTVTPYCEVESEKDDVVIEVIRSICAMILSLTDYVIEGYEEGSKTIAHVNKYERNPINRELCLIAKGYKCSICGFDFESFYGEIGKKFIEVHHQVPVSQMKEGYIVDPIKDLFPLCPNCHAMVHKRNPPYTIDEVKKIIIKYQQKEV